MVLAATNERELGTLNLVPNLTMETLHDLVKLFGISNPQASGLPALRQLQMMTAMVIPLAVLRVAPENPARDHRISRLREVYAL